MATPNGSQVTAPTAPRPGATPVTETAWPATARFSSSFAPEGLGFVQDFLNTDSGPDSADLLDSTESASRWLADALTTARRVDPLAPSTDIPIGPRELVALRNLRSEVRDALRPTPGSEAERPTVSSMTTVSVSHGKIELQAIGGGADLLRSYVFVQLVRAYYRDTIGRLKICANPECEVAFYDRSRNRSGVWHDVATCGNPHNLRKYRQRKKSAVTE